MGLRNTAATATTASGHCAASRSRSGLAACFVSQSRAILRHTAGFQCCSCTQSVCTVEITTLEPWKDGLHLSTIVPGYLSTLLPTCLSGCHLYKYGNTPWPGIVLSRQGLQDRYMQRYNQGTWVHWAPRRRETGTSLGGLGPWPMAHPGTAPTPLPTMPT